MISMNTQNLRSHCLVAAAFVAALLYQIGCSSTPATVSAPFKMPDSFSGTGEAKLTADWWRSFDDPGLEQAIDCALAGNLDLLVAWDRLAQAEAIALREGAPLYPNLDFNAATDRTRDDRDGQTDYESSFLLGLAVSYEVDLWDRIRSAHDAALLDVDVSKQDIRTAAISLAASISTVWYQIAEAQAQIIVINEQIQTNEQLLKLVVERFRQGQVQAADVLRQRQLVRSTEGLLVLANQRAEVLQYQLAVLLGRPPKEDLNLPIPELVEPAPLPQTGVPAELLQRRPDVQSELLNVYAADRRLASVIAAQYPRLSLSADLNTSGVETRDLFDNWLATMAANLTYPVFDARSLEADVKRNEALVSEAFHNYGRTVLEALQDVEDALTNEIHQKEYLQSLRTQLEIANDVIERTEASYLNGQFDYLRVLDALTSRQSLERQCLEAQREWLEYRIQLCRALAGPIELARPPLETLSNNTYSADAQLAKPAGEMSKDGS